MRSETRSGTFWKWCGTRVIEATTASWLSALPRLSHTPDDVREKLIEDDIDNDTIFPWQRLTT
jgi:hypothetical protein